MDRRRFLEAGTASAASLLAASACAPALKLAVPRASTAPDDMDAYIARIDAGMDRLGRWSSADVAPLARRPDPATDALGQAALQSLFLTGMVGDLPLPAQLHPGIQERVERAMPLFDRASDSMTAFLRSRTPNDLAIVQAALRDYGAGARIVDRLDAEAAALGLSEARREQTRSIYAHAEWRLRNQPPALLIGEYVDKMERLASSDVRAEAAAQGIGAQAAEEAFWAARGTRERRITRGGRTMGWGVLIFAVGGGIVAAGAFPGVFVMTAGAVTFIVGIMILLVGLATPGEKTGADTTQTRADSATTQQR